MDQDTEHAQKEKTVSEDMQEVGKVSDSVGRSPAISDQAASMIQVIERAVSNPDVDADKLSQILDVQERIMDRNARMNYTRALAEMASEIPDFPERGKIIHNGNLISTYARWDEDINPILRPILSKYCFHLSFRTGKAEDGMQPITACLSHRDGHSEETTIYVPADKSGSKNSVQAVGSSTSYGKRYAAGALLNITTIRGVDDDGVAAGGSSTISKKEADEIQKRIKSLGIEDAKVKDWMSRTLKVESYEDLNANGYRELSRMLDRKEKEKSK